MKTHEIAPDPALAARDASSSILASRVRVVEVKSADEVKAGIAAMRFASRAAHVRRVGNAPAVGA